jgi:hypothetical protein
MILMECGKKKVKMFLTLFSNIEERGYLNNVILDAGEQLTVKFLSRVHISIENHNDDVN